MFDKVTKILSLCLFLILFGCTRTPVALDGDEINLSIEEDREALSINETLQNIDLHKAIAIAVKNNRDLRISVMESALAQRQNDLQRFDDLNASLELRDLSLRLEIGVKSASSSLTAEES